MGNAWDEPTSMFPTGKHGQNSLYNEGRAADLDLTMPNPDTSSLQSLAIEMDNDIITRFHELATCSNFQHITPNLDDNALRVCVGKQPATHVQKRALLSRTRRSGDVHHHSVREILEKVGRYLYSSNSCMISQIDCFKLHLNNKKTGWLSARNVLQKNAVLHII